MEEGNWPCLQFPEAASPPLWTEVGGWGGRSLGRLRAEDHMGREALSVTGD